jgi:hypothetical protein
MKRYLLLFPYYNEAFARLLSPAFEKYSFNPTANTIL